MHTVVLSIGRNTAAGPLAYDEWHEYRDEVRSALTLTYGTGDGTGEWEGTEEDTFLAIGTADDLEELRRTLARLARTYRQDAIGLLVHDERTGDSLVEAEPEPVRANLRRDLEAPTLRCDRCGRLYCDDRCDR